MELFEIGFVKVRLVDIIDISVVSYLFYKLYESLRGSLALRVISVIISIFLLWKLIDLLEFRLLGSILDPFLSLGAIAVVIIFAPQIRQFLSQISTNTLIDRITRPLSRRTEALTTEVIQEVIESLKSIRATGNGALIVFVGNTPLDHIMDAGDQLDAIISSRLIYTIFQKESPLHDGAMLLEGNKIRSVRCILPISKSTTLDAELGLRHRSAVGLTEISDALVIVVSEERRELSLANGGKLVRSVDYQEIEDAVSRHYQRVGK
ncbi:MAG: diadenylate cyclase [Bacteroidia bacterium]|nr:diadenylate cyclase [Bacteroidia bacterium]